MFISSNGYGLPVVDLYVFFYDNDDDDDDEDDIDDDDDDDVDDDDNSLFTLTFACSFSRLRVT